ncbi:MAG TPA: hypothetical protein VMG99_05885 [Thermoplasmata archaeon]|jgi:hypothetical protein|nr:hypothetical protein [Thermoplasmata archaeon]
MGDAVASRAGRRYRRAHRLRTSRRGVVAVVGTLLALLVFFALFGVFLTQYVPLWMTDNESQFTAQSAASFAQLKSYIDSQYALHGPPVLGTPFALQSNGIPLLAAATQATLEFIPSNCPGGFTATGASAGQPVNKYDCNFANVTIGYGPGGQGTPYHQSMATGILQMSLPNRYYTPETFFMEDDAVIQAQYGGYQIVAFPPPLNVSSYAGNTTVTTSLVQLYGNATSVVGQQSQEVFNTFRYSQTVTSNGKVVGSTLSPTDFVFEIGTMYPCAWFSYLTSVMSGSGLASTHYSITQNGTTTAPTTSYCQNLPSITTIVELNIQYVVNYVTLFYAGTTLSLGVGGS